MGSGNEMSLLFTSLGISPDTTLSPKKRRYLNRIKEAAFLALKHNEADREIAKEDIRSIAQKLSGKNTEAESNEKDLLFSEIALIAARRVSKLDGSEEEVYTAILASLACRFHKKLHKEIFTDTTKIQFANIIADQEMSNYKANMKKIKGDDDSKYQSYNKIEEQNQEKVYKKVGDSKEKDGEKNYALISSESQEESQTELLWKETNVELTQTAEQSALQEGRTKITAGDQISSSAIEQQQEDSTILQQNLKFWKEKREKNSGRLSDESTKTNSSTSSCDPIQSLEKGKRSSKTGKSSNKSKSKSRKSKSEEDTKAKKTSNENGRKKSKVKLIKIITKDKGVKNRARLDTWESSDSSKMDKDELRNSTEDGKNHLIEASTLKVGSIKNLSVEESTKGGVMEVEELICVSNRKASSSKDDSLRQQKEKKKDSYQSTSSISSLDREEKVKESSLRRGSQATTPSKKTSNKSIDRMTNDTTETPSSSNSLSNTNIERVSTHDTVSTLSMARDLVKRKLALRRRKKHSDKTNRQSLHRKIYKSVNILRTSSSRSNKEQQVQARNFQSTNTCDIDVTSLITLHNTLLAPVGHEESTTAVLPFLIKAISMAVEKYPKLSASSPSDSSYGQKHNVSIIMDTDHGLVFPVLKDCKQLSLSQLSSELNKLKQRAHSKVSSTNSKKEEVMEGNYSVNTIGINFGGIISPILLSEQVCGFALGKIRRVPKFVNGSSLDVKDVSMLQISLAVDSTVVDGITVKGVLSSLQGLLEDPLKMMLSMT